MPKWIMGPDFTAPTKITVKYRPTIRNRLAARVSRVVHAVFGGKGLVWCLNHLFHGQLRVNTSVDELGKR